MGLSFWNEQPDQEKICNRSKITARSTPDQYRAGMSASPFSEKTPTQLLSWERSARFLGREKLFLWLESLILQGFQGNPPKNSKKVFYKKRFSVNLQMSAAIKPRRNNQEK